MLSTLGHPPPDSGVLARCLGGMRVLWRWRWYAARHEGTRQTGYWGGMITATDLSKSFGARVLFAGCNLQLDPGQRVGIVGANGAGKSTLLRILIGEEEATTGDIHQLGAARVGVLIKGGEVLERLADVRQVALDKTGTLTSGQIEVTRVDPVAASDVDSLLRLGAAAAGGPLIDLGGAAGRNEEHQPEGGKQGEELSGA